MSMKFKVYATSSLGKYVKRIRERFNFDVDDEDFPQVGYFEVKDLSELMDFIYMIDQECILGFGATDQPYIEIYDSWRE